MSTPDPFASFREEISQAVLDLLAEIPLFSALSGPEISAAAEAMNVIDVSEGDVVFLEGERGDYVCFVAEGALSVSKKVAGSDRRALITTLEKGHSIGEMALIDEAPRSATVVALAPTRLVALTRNGFEGLIKKDPEIGIKLMKGLARVLSTNLRRTSSKLADTLLPVC